MKPDAWLEILARAPASRIAEIPAFGPGHQAPTDPAGSEAEPVTQEAFALSPALWPMLDDTVARFGVRIRKAPTDPRPLAVRLAAAAIERGAEPVILSHVPASGFEQAGFRVERIHGATGAERQVQEAELSRFWSLAIIVDLEEAAGMS